MYFELEMGIFQPAMLGYQRVTVLRRFRMRNAKNQLKKLKQEAKEVPLIQILLIFFIKIYTVPFPAGNKALFRDNVLSNPLIRSSLLGGNGGIVGGDTVYPQIPIEFVHLFFTEFRGPPEAIGILGPLSGQNLHGGAP